MISHPSKSIKAPLRYIGGGAIVTIGLIFSDQLGFSVYGDWAPFGQFAPWMVFNMPTLIAAIIVVAVFKLETNQGFQKDLSLFAGVIILLLVLAMLSKLIWIQPIMDAPLNHPASSASSPPMFFSLSLFIFSGFGAFLIQILSEEGKNDKDPKSIFRRLQAGSLIKTVYMSLLVISLAAALGIGAWKTHFMNWTMELNILDYLNLAISSNLNLIYQYADTGNLLHTVLLAALCFTGFSFLLTCANQLSLEEADQETVASLVIEAKIPQAIGVFLASAYFIGNGIGIRDWAFIGLLAWFLFCHLTLGMRLHGKNKIHSAITLLVIALGCFQAILIIIAGLINGHYIFSGLFASVLLIAVYLWTRDIKDTLKNLTLEEKPSF